MGRNRRTDSLEMPKRGKKEDTFGGRFCKESDPKLHSCYRTKHYGEWWKEKCVDTSSGRHVEILSVRL